MIRVYKLHATLIKTGQHQNPHSLRPFFLTCSNYPAAARYAATVLLRLPTPPDPFSYNTIIKHVSPTGAISLFSHMHRNSVPFDHFTFPLILKHHHHHLLHSLIFKLGFDTNIFVQNALINAYGSRGSLDVAVKLFDEMRRRDIVSWSTLISCLVKNNLPAEALSVFQQMQMGHRDIRNWLDRAIMLSVISAVSSLGVIELGIWVHSFIVRMGIVMTVPLGTALINMYSRCGLIDRSVKVFDEMPERNVVTWTALINGLAVHGRSREALKVFYEMKESGLKPDGALFIGVLVACSHGGLVEDGWRVFESMRDEFGIKPMLEHYGCMVDLLGRAGLILEAFDFVEEMPLKPNSVIWRTLLGACVNHNHLGLAEKARERIIELDPYHDGDYVLLSNAYGRVGNWGGKAGLRNSMKQNRIVKEPGLSFVHIDQVVHEFVSGDHVHPQWEEITKFLASIIDTVKLGGYTPNTSSVLHDIQDEEKEHCLGYHSEKLAVAFVLLYHRDRRTIRVIKNLRICYDCHDFMKHASGIFDRDIIIRDRNRFHHFSKGLCSCQDFW
ncbi:putative tetratricopeptide-like helical domain, DYW domain-containing protein [Medicago truncatula]|uniref:Pentatricopeptide (PPR) repeat protein n=2 Tax=Medicago truncatula TaxID=3880 RepID=G7J2Q3_MEDTR|nr:pentatricopeptide (PPR) repeat protein [Medicago truncatula]RHN70047.1 putative tetratricopeptide-like helical domain, DYW domain-containing protein [Medicago truncatula]